MGKRRSSPLVIGSEDFTYGPMMTADVLCNRGSSLTMCAGENDLPTTQDKGVGRTQSSHQLVALTVSQGTHKE
jgi:hypothetical protein